MNIILLSGGSGKRLWPLSNDVRSKQFIKLFKNENGEYESMVQRVNRQIKNVDPEARITIATSKSQVSAIHNQLGEAVSICVEPSRRDTFPAIALAVAYLRDVRKAEREEPVIVCPVDPFVEDRYFESVQQLEALVRAGGARLTLMGIKPTYPSEKYGYIVPCTLKPVSPVREFKEKPDREHAETYIGSGALWNAGVFAFKIGYILDKVQSMVGFSDYEGLYSHYAELEKISFDYAVVEKEPSIQVMRFEGEWKDVGTWNTMSEVMADRAKGNVALDGECVNTNVVNELDIPILVMGAKDMVIAASGDGILIADKERSGYMKPFVEKISTDVHFAEKSWGNYSVVDATPSSLTVKVVLKPGNRMSYHSHQYRDEVWTVLQGSGVSVIEGMEQAVRAGDVITMAAGCKHTIIARTEMVLLETQLGKEISVRDKKKFTLPAEIDI